MNQPDLGKYISNLRKEQGLTQEELVEKCNINVRTIQRIEAGEVTPRSYTVKNILEALGKTIDDVFQKEEKQPQKVSKNYNKPLLGWGILCGIIYLIVSAFDVTIIITKIIDTAPVSNLMYGALITIEVLAVIILQIAISHYGKANKNSLLEYVSYGSIVFFIVNYFIGYLSYSDIIDLDSGFGQVMNFSMIFLTGLIYLLIAIGFFIKRKETGELTKWIGLTGIITGICFCLIIFSPLGMITMLAFEVLILILLYQTWDISNENNRGINS